MELGYDIAIVEYTFVNYADSASQRAYSNSRNSLAMYAFGLPLKNCSQDPKRGELSTLSEERMLAWFISIARV